MFSCYNRLFNFIIISYHHLCNKQADKTAGSGIKNHNFRVVKSALMC